jgi:hypothetical protein
MALIQINSSGLVLSHKANKSNLQAVTEFKESLQKSEISNFLKDHILNALSTSKKGIEVKVYSTTKKRDKGGKLRSGHKCFIVPNL